MLALPPLCARSFDQISSTRLACLEARTAATAAAAFELPPVVASRTCGVAERYTWISPCVDATTGFETYTEFMMMLHELAEEPTLFAFGALLARRAILRRSRHVVVILLQRTSGTFLMVRFSLIGMHDRRHMTSLKHGRMLLQPRRMRKKMRTCDVSI